MVKGALAGAVNATDEKGQLRQRSQHGPRKRLCQDAGGRRAVARLGDGAARKRGQYDDAVGRLHLQLHEPRPEEAHQDGQDRQSREPLRPLERRVRDRRLRLALVARRSVSQVSLARALLSRVELDRVGAATDCPCLRAAVVPRHARLPARYLHGPGNSHQRAGPHGLVPLVHLLSAPWRAHSVPSDLLLPRSAVHPPD